MRDEPPADGDGDTDAATRRAVVRERYASIARDADSTARCGDSGDCCGDSASDTGSSGVTGSARSDEYSNRLGYSDADLASVAPGANLGLGCGNPTAIAALAEGETVLDLGSGAGFDCFLATREVGPGGQVIGVDMTPEMVERARENAATNEVGNVSFRLGEIEHLPVADGVVDVVISNCVVNLSPDKPRVFREAFRVLRPAGRLAVSDVVLTAEPPDDVEMDPESVAACVGGASSIPDLEATLCEAGFTDVTIEPKADSGAFIREWDDDRDLSEFLVSATIEATKPG